MKKLFKTLVEGIGFFKLEKIKEYPVQFAAVAALLIVLVVLLLLLIKKQKNRIVKAGTINTKVMVIGAMCIAIAYILSFIKWELPQSGSFTLASGLPIIIFAYIYGPKYGLAAAFAYSLLQLTQGPVTVGIVQFLLDYPIAFTAYGLAGFFKKNIIPGIVVGYMTRLACHVISGAIFFSEYAADYGLDPVSYSIAYNGIVLIPEMILCIIIVLIPQFRKMISDLKRQYA